ncbi:hypothetical protein [Amycolatopsis sp.]|uniref:hypothetical protein n=1 Tax=Amycolatopsis sp. TaxID=37632 RepID=UPI002D7F0FFA|nr:hypothetical protein [Amycolatopsis sp.]HET6704348.1 hypothetical protein [Amycolatopsis sp.]
MSTERPEYPPVPPPGDDGWGSEDPAPGYPMHRPPPKHPLPDLDSEDGPPPRRGGPTG